MSVVVNVYVIIWGRNGSNCWYVGVGLDGELLIGNFWLLVMNFSIFCVIEMFVLYFVLYIREWGYSVIKFFSGVCVVVMWFM